MQRPRIRAIVPGLLACLASGLLLAGSNFDVWIICMAATAPLLLVPALDSALRWASRKAHTNALSTLPCGITIVAPDGRVSWANDAFASLLGRTSSELRGTSFADIMGNDAWTSLLTRKDEIAAGKSVQIAGGMARADGRAAWVSGYASALGGKHELVVQVVDLSRYRDSHASLLKSVAQYRQVVDTSDNLIVMIDRHGRILHANPAASAALCPGAVLVHRSIIEFIDPDDRPGLIDLIKSTRHDEQPRELTPLRLKAAGTMPGEETRLAVAARLASLPVPGGTDGCIISCRVLESQLASEKQLRISEARFSRIFHSSPDAILIVRNADSTILDFNAGFTRLLGHTREEAIGVNESNLDLWPCAVERKRILEMLVAERECTDLETRLRTRDGRHVPVEISLRYIEIEGELCILCIGRDVSKRAVAEAALKESEEKFARVFSRSPDGIAIIRERDLVICDINDALVEASGYPREQLVGFSLEELDVFANAAELPNAMKLLATNDQFANVEMLFKTPSGVEIPALVSATTLEVGGERCVLCIAKDLRDLRATEDQLQVSEERFRGAFENAPIGIMLLDMEGRIFQANRFAAQLLDYAEHAMHNLHVSRLVPPEERPRYKSLLQRLTSGVKETLRIEQRLVCASGLEMWTNMHMVLQRDRDGAPSYCIVQIADITEMKISQQRMERMAFYDILTDLANRRLFYDRLGHAIDHATRNQRLAALLYLDLDQFKRVNDTLGHEAGDVLLRAVAARLTDSVRAEDTVGRPGGDEFTILLYDIATSSDASLVAEKILSVLRRPITLSGQQLVVSASVGIAIVPTDGSDPAVLMKNADLAMYRAKERGRNQFQFYSEEMNTNAASRLKTEYELRQALDERQFELHFQPKMRLTDRQAVGVECLLRWRHPERGLLAPGEFMRVAEETGAIVAIGKWIIETACLAAKELSDGNSAICTALNISSRQFRDPGLVNTVRRCLRQSGLSPDHLEIEITETMLMDDVEAASQTVRQLHDLGVRLAIDDFGTGYSSLNYLKKFPIDTVKVDRSFITDIPNSADDMAITAAVIAMAHRLNMEVVAEGVETQEQLEFLKGLGCEYAQGYLFSKALPLHAVKQFVAPNVHLLQAHRSDRPRNESR